VTRDGSLASSALLLKRVSYAESDLVVTVLTEELGKLSLLARGARQSRRRFGGSLEAMHTLALRFDERRSGDLGLLREARLETVRARLAADLDRLEAAGRALGWVRRAAPVRTPEPRAWRVIIALLDRLDAEAPLDPARELAAGGLGLLSALGWGLELERCVGCGRRCDPGRAALVDPARGGLVCRSCGGARFKLSGAVRGRLARAVTGDPSALEPPDVPTALELAERALSAHMGID
jgi:DNA repair protein RecO (recombination protein O)